jgi:hypothetical protein
VDASLRRLRTDYIDLYQCHRYDPETPLGETMEALSEAVRSGKVRYLGFSEWSAEQIRAAIALPASSGSYPASRNIDALAQTREDVIPLCAANGISQIVWRHSDRACSPANTAPMQRLPRDTGNQQDMGGFMESSCESRSWTPCRSSSRLRHPPASARRSSHSPGFCGNQMSRLPSLVPPDPNRWMRTQPHRERRSILPCRRGRAHPGAG